MKQLNKKDLKRPSIIRINSDSRWEKKFKELVSFKKKYGHCYVPLRPPDATGLGRWVNNQRRLAKNDKLKKERVKRLKKIGFSFNAFEDRWKEMFSALVAFKNLYGHCNVPFDWPKNPKLGRWVHTNRDEMKKGRLEKERFQQLQGIGFVWRRHDAAWEEMYTELLGFKDEFGHCRVPQNWKDSKLAMWVAHQRGFFKKGSLNNYRVNKLKEVGFQWTAREKMEGAQKN